MFKEKFKYLAILLFVFWNSSCTQKTEEKEFTDKEFLEYISNDNLRISIAKIDSLLQHVNYTDHRRAILFHEKGRLLANLEKDLEAVGSLKEALFLFQKENNKAYLAKTNNLLGDSYAFLSKLDTAAAHTNTAYKLYQEIGHKKGEAKTLNSLGHLSFLKNDFSASIGYVKDAIVIQLELNNKETLSASYNNLGYILEQVEDYDQAILYYNKALKLNKEIDRLNTNPLRNLGAVYLLKKDVENGKYFFKEALKVEEQKEQFVTQKEIYDALIEISLTEEDYASISLYTQKKDSVSQLLYSYDTKEKEKLINSKYEQFTAQENLKQELELNKKNKIILGSILGLLVVLGLYFLQKNKNSRLLLEQEKLALEQKMLRTQMNPHFIFNALTAIQSTVFDNDPLKASTYLSRFAKLIRQNFEFVSMDEITIEEDLDALKNYLETQQLRYNYKFDYHIKIDDDISFLKIPPMLLQPFVENAIEHGLREKTKDGLITIEISQEEDYLKFLISDNGIGYDYTTKSTAKEHAIDVFLKRLQLRNYGEEKLFSIKALDNNKGTLVTIKLLLR